MQSGLYLVHLFMGQETRESCSCRDLFPNRLKRFHEPSRHRVTKIAMMVPARIPSSPKIRMPDEKSIGGILLVQTMTCPIAPLDTRPLPRSKPFSEPHGGNCKETEKAHRGFEVSHHLQLRVFISMMCARFETGSTTCLSCCRGGSKKQGAPCQFLTENTTCRGLSGRAVRPLARSME